MLGVTEASDRIMAAARPLPPERVPLLDALGRVLATTVVAPLTIPAADNSAMDGYAVMQSDVERASAEHPVTLDVLETIAAGGVASQPLRAGAASRIMTGAPIPSGADSVVRVEDTDGGVERVTIHDARDAGKNVRRRGEDIREGSVVFQPATPLGPAQIGVLASIGAASVDVYRRPRVAFLASGNEIVDLDRFNEVMTGDKTVTSNSYTLHAMIRAAGGEPINLGVARDDPEDVKTRLTRAAGADVIITSAGISAGEHDYVRPVLAELGVTLDVWKVRMRPGAPVGFGMLGGSPWIGLPGNPVSTMVTFELFVRPLLRRLQGHERVFRQPVDVVLEEPVSIAVKLTHFMRVMVQPRPDGRLGARLTGPQGSGILSSMARANALLIVPEDVLHRDAGATMHALLLSDEGAYGSQFRL